MIRPAQLLRSLVIATALLALGAPTLGLAAEPTTTTAPAPTSEGVATTPEAAPGTSSTSAAPAPPTTTTPAAPQVQAEVPQGNSPGAPPVAVGHSKHKSAAAPTGSAGAGTSTEGPRAKQKAASPSALTPSLPSALTSSISGVPGFFIESFRIPPFLLPIYQAAGTAYGIPWQVLAAINEVETDYGRDLSVSSAGAEGWMQFLPAEWAQYGLDANGDGFKDPYNPADAIFAAARYLRAAGGNTNIKAGIFSYNHSQAYVESVMLRAQLLGGTPPELLGAITGLTEAHFPVHAAAHFTDGFLTVPNRKGQPQTLVGTTIDTQAGAPVIAAQDGEIVSVGQSPTLGRYVTLRDAYGNTYVYAQLGDVSSVYPVLEPHVNSSVSNRIAQEHEPAPSGPATAGAQDRSPVSEGATVSGLSLGAAAGLEPAPSAPAPTPPTIPPVIAPTAKVSHVKVFREGPNDVYLRPLRVGAQVIAGTVLGHVATAGASGASVDGQPHIFFQIRPAGVGAPLIDPKPVLDGWVALENTSIFRAKGENPFLATSPTIGQVLLESKQQLEPQVLHDAGIHLSRCGRQDVQTGRIDKRVLAALEYLSVSGLKPTVAGLRCNRSSAAVAIANAPATADAYAISITAVNGVPIAGHQGQGSIADVTVRKLLMLQGISRPRRIVSLESYPGAPVAVASPSARNAIGLTFSAPSGAAQAASSAGSSLAPGDWIKLIARLGEIPDPTVGRGPSAAAIPDSPKTSPSQGAGNGGH
ncbi:MAG TPA: lytic murein transglycosylase [Solirubrobacteraceae bacterium]|jgi:membrane-bound lytic murein transglycosylase B|nr:lytic murein transglycosylase [Solirubrobacteraceae bacterium]